LSKLNMANFRYKAINRVGQPLQGQIQAETPESAKTMLAEQGCFVQEIEAQQSAAAEIQTEILPAGQLSNLKISEKHRVEFIGQMATALQAKLPLTTALDVVGGHHSFKKIKTLTAQIQRDVQAGQSLSQSMARFPRIFDSLHLSMVHTGEAVGQLDRSMGELAELGWRDYEIRNNILTASLYPAFVLGLGLVSVIIVITWILPQILGTLSVDIESLPWPTRVISHFSQFLRRGGWIVLLFAVFGGYLTHQWRKTSLGRYAWDSLILKVPVLGKVKQKWAVASFAKTLGILTRCGINILDALKIVRNTMNNEVLARDVDDLVQQVRTGSTLAQPLKKYGHFPPLLVQIVSVGEQTGQLDTLLLQAAEAFDRDTQTAVKRFMAVFPAFMILLLAILVGFIVAATLLPIVQLETALPGM